VSILRGGVGLVVVGCGGGAVGEMVVATGVVGCGRSG